MTYATTPLLVAKNRATFTRLGSLYRRALNPNQTRAVRMLGLGDSKSTFPAGQGHYEHAMFQYLWGKHFGHNIPETPLTAQMHFGGSGDDPDASGNMLLSNASAGGDTSGQSATFQPYNLEGTNAATLSTDLGAIYHLHHNYRGTQPSSTFIPRTFEYFKRTGHKLEIFIPRIDSQHTVAQWASYEHADTVHNYFAASTASGTINTAAATSVQGNVQSCAGAEGPVRSYLTPAITWTTTPSAANLTSVFGSWQCRGNDGSTRLTICGALLRSADTRGFGYTVSGAAGLNMADIVANRADSYNTWNAYGPNIITIMFGTNDAGNSVSATTFKADAEELVSWIQTNIDDETGTVPLIILESSAPRTGLTGAQQTEFDLYADKLAEIAAGTESVLALNTRRMFVERGFTTGAHTSDGIHYNEAGGWLAASARFDLMRRAMRGNRSR